MTRAITVVLLVLAVGLAAIAVWRSNLLIGILATGPLLLLAASAAGSGRIAGQTAHLIGRPVSLRIWGAPPRRLSDAMPSVERVLAFGAGLHLFVRIQGGAGLIHIKVAQPRQWSVDQSSATIADAKYVQISGKTSTRLSGQPALEIVLHSSDHSNVP